MSEGKKIRRFMFGGTRKLEVGKMETINTGLGICKVLVTKTLTTQEAFAYCCRLAWEQIVRNCPPGMEIYWYEGETEQCQKEDTNHPERTGAHGTN